MDNYKQINTKENYSKLLSTGMFWEFYPELTGNWDNDKELIDKSNQDNIKEQKLLQLCYNYLNKFTDLYPKDKNIENQIPKNIKLTVYCNSGNSEGFIFNLTYQELGLEALIVEKWIIHSELEKLIGYSFN